MRKGRTRPRQLARVALGLCPDCGEEDAAPGGLRCAACRDAQNAQHRARWAALRASGVLECAELRKKKARLAQARRARLRAAGRCIQCQRPSPRFLRCTACRVAGAGRQRRRRVAKERVGE